MAFADPQSLNFGGGAISFNRTGSGIDVGQFLGADATNTYRLSISHAYNKRTRKTMRLDIEKIAADVLDSSVNVPYSMSCYMVLDVPKVGFNSDTQAAVVDGFADYLLASSGAAITKFVGGQS